ncbi:hypothetical protein EJ06DRAFT_478592 [Trichodelitschia bisporula]|uniref:L domain-like protein n=1 Tax=Trichodelitschia bisporula TaxID=703511 RepID=A0A6G1HUM7_9PEZI|nr:hypothetical protein EJ06DRAFT_478592 [Trichodelitschia bisporula]
MDTEDGQTFIKTLAYFVRTHEKALANALQLQRQNSGASHVAGGAPTSPITPSSSASTLASALSMSFPRFPSRSVKPVKLTLTPHHLFYLLSRFSELGIAVGPMDIRLENLHTAAPSNYVSFLDLAQRKKLRNSDRDSIHSVSSIRSVMSTMSSLFAGFGLSKSSSKSEKQKAQTLEDLKYLYSAFTKVPCLRLAPDHQAPLISGYEEFPFDAAVPLFAFKNLSSLEICDVDFRQFCGWDRMADQLRSLSVKRANLDDPMDLLINIVLDDMEKRRRRSAKGPPTPVNPWPAPPSRHMDLTQSGSLVQHPASPERTAGSPGAIKGRPRSASPRPSASRTGSSHSHSEQSRCATPKAARRSSASSESLHQPTPRHSTSNLLSINTLPLSKWRFLVHLSLADNGLAMLSGAGFAPLASTLSSLDLSNNLFTEIPDSLATLTALRSLNMGNCMIESLHSLRRHPLPAITVLNLRGNRLPSLSGIERLPSLERVDLRENKLTDPTEIARLTGIPNIFDVFVNRNPFTKTHSNYRVAIFNLFRKTPGYTEDICIDGASPSYSERKALVDRVLEPSNAPFMKPLPKDPEIEEPQTPPTYTATTSRESLPSTPTDSATDNRSRRSGHQRRKSDYGVSNSQRRRKATKRRIVELAQADFNLERRQSEPVATHRSVATDHTPADLAIKFDPVPVPPKGVAAEDSTYGTSVEDTPERPPKPTDQPNIISAQIAPPPAQPALLPPLETPSPPLLRTGLRASSDSAAPVMQPQFGPESESYRQKIEALRTDLGSAWLSALSDEAWDAQQRGNTFSPSLPLGTGVGVAGVAASVPVVRAAGQGIVSGGRTLG